MFVATHDAELLVLYVRPPIDAREFFDPARVPDVDGYCAPAMAREGLPPLFRTPPLG